jgi:hypothetical protein
LERQSSWGPQLGKALGSDTLPLVRFLPLMLIFNDSVVASSNPVADGLLGSSSVRGPVVVTSI